MKKNIKAALALLCALPLLFLSGCDNTRSGVKNYDTFIEKVTYAETFMPALEDVGAYEHADAYYRYIFRLMFESRSVNLTLTYSAENYEQQKQAALAGYQFDEIVESEQHLHKPSCAKDCAVLYDTVSNYCTYRTYTIYVVSPSDLNPDYRVLIPKYFGMIGFSDTNHKICYLYYYDYDLDILGDMTEFLDGNFTFG